MEFDRSSFEAMITDIYNLTTLSDQGLREVAVKLTVGYLAGVRDRANLSEELLERLPNFAAHLSIAMINSSLPSGGLFVRLMFGTKNMRFSNVIRRFPIPDYSVNQRARMTGVGILRFRNWILESDNGILQPGS